MWLMERNETVIRVGDDPVTLINVFDVDAAKQQELGDILAEGTEKVVQDRPGFCLGEHTYQQRRLSSGELRPVAQLRRRKGDHGRPGRAGLRAKGGRTGAGNAARVFGGLRPPRLTRQDDNADRRRHPDVGDSSRWTWEPASVDPECPQLGSGRSCTSRWGPVGRERREARRQRHSCGGPHERLSFGALHVEQPRVVAGGRARAGRRAGASHAAAEGVRPRCISTVARASARVSA